MRKIIVGAMVSMDGFMQSPETRSLPMTPTITAFEPSPDRGKGLARDLRVRWALEEVANLTRFVLFRSVR